MRKAIFAFLISATLLSGCSLKTPDKNIVSEEQMMMVVDETIGYVIYVHKNTGVMYFSGRSTCVMLDSEGNPLIYSEDNYK